MRPLIEHYEKRGEKLALRLQFLDILGFFVNSAGTVLVSLDLTTWVSLTVAVVAVITGIVEFTQLRNQVVSINLALSDCARHPLMILGYMYTLP